MLEMQFPDMADLDRPRTPEQWDAVLFRVRKEIERLSKLEPEGGPPEPKVLKPGTRLVRRRPRSRRTCRPPGST